MNCVDPDETEQSKCPNCGAWVDDLDGFGVLIHEACGYCEHASRSGDGAGNWKCNACGKALEPLRDRPEATVPHTRPPSGFAGDGAGI